MKLLPIVVYDALPGIKVGPISFELKEAPQYGDLGEIRHDLDTLLAADSVCLRPLSDLPQSGNL